MPYLIYNTATGVENGSLEPTLDGLILAPGYAAVEVPGSYLVGKSSWSRPLRAFEDNAPRVLPPNTFLTRFTVSEQQALFGSGDWEVRRILAQIAGSDAVDLDDPGTEYWIDILVVKTMITSERCAAILSGAVV